MSRVFPHTRTCCGEENICGTHWLPFPLRPSYWKPGRVGPPQRELTSGPACQGSGSKGFLPGCREGLGCRPGGPEIYPFAPRLMINRSWPSPCLAGEPRARLGQEEPDSICLCSEVSEIGSTLGWLHLMDLESTGIFWGHLGPGQNPYSPWGSVASSQMSTQVRWLQTGEPCPRLQGEWTSPGTADILPC